MKSSIPYIISILLAMSSFSCMREEPPFTGNPPLVVEGWIERGERPIVMVTHSIDMTADSMSLDNIVEKWCRVSIFDNGEQHILIGKVDRDYSTGFIFTTSQLRGVEGHAYTLRIETESDTIESTSIMPETPIIESLTPILAEGSDSLYKLNLKVKDIDRDSYYKVFTKSASIESRFYGSFLGTFTGADYDEENGIDVTRGVHSSYEDDNFNHYFKKGEQVTVKLCTMEELLFNFWKTYDNNVSLSGNLFFTFTENCPHTFPDSFGYWGAYGMSRQTILIK